MIKLIAVAGFALSSLHRRKQLHPRQFHSRITPSHRWPSAVAQVGPESAVCAWPEAQYAAPAGRRADVHFGMGAFAVAGLSFDDEVGRAEGCIKPGNVAYARCNAARLVSRGCHIFFDQDRCPRMVSVKCSRARKAVSGHYVCRRTS